MENNKNKILCLFGFIWAHYDIFLMQKTEILMCTVFFLFWNLFSILVHSANHSYLDFFSFVFSSYLAIEWFVKKLLFVIFSPLSKYGFFSFIQAGGKDLLVLDLFSLSSIRKKLKNAVGFWGMYCIKRHQERHGSSCSSIVTLAWGKMLSCNSSWHFSTVLWLLQIYHYLFLVFRLHYYRISCIAKVGETTFVSLIIFLPNKFSQNL